MRNDTTQKDGPGMENNASKYIRIQQNPQVRKNIQDISKLLNTGLSPEALEICIKLCEAGAHPQALAEVVTQIRREVTSLDNES